MPPKKKRKTETTVKEGSDIIFGESAVVDPNDLLPGSIGTFPLMTDKAIRVFSKYDKYGPKAREIKDRYIKGNESLFVRGEGYPAIYQSPKRGFGFGQPLKPSKYNQQFGRKLFAGDEGTNLTQEDINRGQTDWNYKVMKLQKKKEEPKKEEIEWGPNLTITGVRVPTPNSWNRGGGKKKRRRRRTKKKKRRRRGTKKKRRKRNLKKRTRRRRRKSKRRRRR